MGEVLERPGWGYWRIVPFLRRSGELIIVMRVYCLCKAAGVKAAFKASDWSSGQCMLFAACGHEERHSELGLCSTRNLGR